MYSWLVYQLLSGSYTSRQVLQGETAFQSGKEEITVDSVKRGVMKFQGHLVDQEMTLEEASELTASLNATRYVMES